MSTINSITTVTITLTLNIEEAEWLKSLTQNYLGQQFGSGEEIKEEYTIRTEIYESLASVLDRSCEDFSDYA